MYFEKKDIFCFLLDVSPTSSHFFVEMEILEFFKQKI